MAPVRRLLATLLIVCFASAAGRAQEQPLHPRQILSGMAGEVFLPADTLLERRHTLEVQDGRFDPVDRVLRMSRRFDRDFEPPADGRYAAAAVLQREHDRFGWAVDGGDLELVSVSERPRSTHVLYRQVVDGIPVHNRYVRVSLDAEGYPTLVLSDYEPRVAREGHEIAREAAVTAGEARRAAEEAFISGTHVRTTSKGLAIYPGHTPRLAWQIIAWPELPGGEWEFLIDAQTGDFLQVMETSLRFRNRSGTHAHGAGNPLQNHTEVVTREVVDGTGYVFDPDPLTSANTFYGAPFVNNGDNDSPELNAARRLATLPSITRDDDGLYRLIGPHLRIVGENAENRTVYTPPAEAHPDSFRYTRSNDFFEAVNVYFHIDASQRYVQQLGFLDRQNQPIPVNPHGEGTVDQSRYYPHLNFLSFGTGRVDDAEDVDVILHEYGHALLEAGVPGVLSTMAGRAIHEGWADYWAASYRRFMVETGAWPEHDWRRLFRWDAGFDGEAGTYWPGRVVNHSGQYPDSLVGNRWTDGLLLATTLMEVFDHTGREKSDELNLQAHLYLTAGAGFPDYAYAVIQAEIDLYEGRDAAAIIGVFVERGFVSRSSFAPMIAHDPARDATDTGEALLFEVAVSSYSGDISDVRLHYEIDGTWRPPAAMSMSEPGRYFKELALPEGVDSVSYFFSATDEHGETAMLPADAPASVFRIGIHTDVTPPEIRHAPVVRASLDGWPVELEALITDASGVDTAWVSFRVLGEGAQGVRDEGEFGLQKSDEFYEATFPISAEIIQPGDVIEYRLHARDGALPSNEKVLPAADEPPFAFTVEPSGIIRFFSFEGPHRGMSAEGQWEAGVPALGLYAPLSGSGVMATRLDSAYVSDGTISSLTLPALSPAGRDAYLVFYHWYSTFQNETGAVDGGLVRWSADGGATWEPFELESPPAVPITHDKNPMYGAPAFAGQALNWRRTVLPLPHASQVQIRFDFATAEHEPPPGPVRTGWIIDHAYFTTVIDADSTPPQISETPPPLVTVVPEEELDPILVRITDEHGIDFARLHYVAENRNGQVIFSDSISLEMDGRDFDLYSGELPISPGGMTVGSRIRYFVEAVDYFGNASRVPDEGSFFLIEYRREAARNLLANAVRTGIWRPEEAGWQAARRDGAERLSSLVLEPVEVPANAAEATLQLEHRFNLGSGAGGNLKRSLDDGASWKVVLPDAGYPAQLQVGSDVQPVFSGVNGEPFVTTNFDLSPYAGKQVRLRVDFAAIEELSETDSWEIRSLQARFSTLDEDFETPRELALHGNFPNPFRDRTSISFTLDAPGFVEVRIFDTLGREVMQLLSEDRVEGSHTISLDGTNLANGLYLLRLDVNGQRLVRKITLIR